MGAFTSKGTAMYAATSILKVKRGVLEMETVRGKKGPLSNEAPSHDHQMPSCREGEKWIRPTKVVRSWKKPKREGTQREKTNTELILHLQQLKRKT